KMTTTSGGNLSIRDDAGDVFITPARFVKGSLTRDDIVRIRAEGHTEGRHKPSSEHPFHQAIYAARPDLRAVGHAHPVALVAFSICRRTPDTSLFPQAAHVCGRVGYAPYQLPGSEALGRAIAEAFAKGFNCVMLENHGVVIGGADLAQAFQRFETLEFTAKTIIKASQLAKVRYLSQEQLALAERPRPAPPEAEPGPATTLEKELRRSLCDFIHRGYRQRLLTSTGGSFSARLDANSFLISSYGVDRQTISPEQLTLIHSWRREPGRTPSRAVQIHWHLYRDYPAIQAIVNATPVNATAFSVTREGLDARTIPESFLFLGNVPTVPFAAQFGDGNAIAAIVSPNQPVALMENNGALILGKSILDAFDRLEVLESTAEALINSRPLGPLCPMTDLQIDELKTAFGML
ncbi:MAG: class II aldolase/adducin family protein, partial [Tepidisphaeraceae bacterium]